MPRGILGWSYPSGVTGNEPEINPPDEPLEEEEESEEEICPLCELPIDSCICEPEPEIGETQQGRTTVSGNLPADYAEKVSDRG